MIFCSVLCCMVLRIFGSAVVLVCVAVTHCENSTAAPATCASYYSCDACFAQASCAWCFTEQLCVPAGAPLSLTVSGDCLPSLFGELQGSNRSLLAQALCTDCSEFTCAECVGQSACGWDGGACFNKWLRSALLNLTLNGVSDYCICECNDTAATNSSCCANQSCSSTSNTCDASNLTCPFGLSGLTCTTPCNCSGHGLCSRSNPQSCTCVHNTTGPQCAVCAPGYFTDEEGDCLSCFDYCNRLSTTCVGGNFSSNGVCQDCAFNTAGDRCQQCDARSFYNASQKRCIRCECNWQSVDDSCGSTGMACICGNNTMTVCSSNSTVSCRQQQCTTCTHGYQGTPSGPCGFVCYKTLDVNTVLCLSPGSTGSCLNNMSLSPNTLSFFSTTQLRTDLPVRVVVEIEYGVANVYLGLHTQAYSLRYVNGVYTVRNAAPQPLIPLTYCPTVYSPSPLDVSQVVSTYVYAVAPSRGLPTFFTAVDALRGRLVFFVDPEVLATSAGYHPVVIVQAVAPSTRGEVYFVQASAVPRMDLFVFFAVFFASFSLAVATLVCLGRARRAICRRHLRQRRAVEMALLVRRPFAKVAVLFGPAAEGGSPEMSLRSFDDEEDRRAGPSTASQLRGVPQLISSQPLSFENGAAAVGSVLVMMPRVCGGGIGGQLSFGCALVVTPPDVTKALSPAQRGNLAVVHEAAKNEQGARVWMRRMFAWQAQPTAQQGGAEEH